MHAQYLCVPIQMNELETLNIYFKFITLNFMKKVLFAFALLFGSLFSVNAAGNVYRATILLYNNIEIKIEVIDVIKNCNSSNGNGYHYGEIFNIKSKSLNNSSYTITFNGYIRSALGTGDHSYFSTVTLSNTNPNSMNFHTQNNGKLVQPPLSAKLKCNDLTTDNINLTDVSIVFWSVSINGLEPVGESGRPVGLFQTTLPISLLSFDATANQNQVNLSWATASEKNNDFFTIERTVDGIDFEEVGKVAGQGNSSLKNEYTFSDTRPKNGISYYRLKQTDYNGESEYFEVKSVNIQKGDFVSNVYPNPAVMNRTTVFVEKNEFYCNLECSKCIGSIDFE